MWPGFDELRQLKHSKEEQNNSKKRKSFNKNDKTAPKRRRRSLFSPSSSSQEKTETSCFVGRPSHNTNEIKISDFSSDDEKDQCQSNVRTGVIKLTQDQLNTSSKNAKKCMKPASLSNSKSTSINKLQILQKGQVIRPAVHLEKDDSIIKWSDSDSECDGPKETLKVSEDVVIEKEHIELFDSPFKTKDKGLASICQQDGSQTLIEDCTPSPQPQMNVKTEQISQNNLVEGEFVPKYVDSSKKRRLKDIKGGLVEQLRKVASRERSNVVFWKHSSNEEKCSVTVSSPKRDEPKLILKVIEIKNDFCLSILKCCTLGGTFKHVHIILPENLVAEDKIEKHNILQIFPPYRNIRVEGIKHNVLLCAYFVKVVANSTEQLGMIDEIEAFEIPTPETQESSVDSSATNSSMSRSQVVSYIGTEFYKCSLSLPVTFSASVIKSNLIASMSLPKFPTNSDESIIDFMKKMCQEGARKEQFELMLILKDGNSQIAILTKHIEDDQVKELCHLSEAKGESLIFQNFFLKGIKNITQSPSLHSVLKNLELTAREKFFGDMCFVFTGFDESVIQLHEAGVNSTCKSSDVYNDILPTNLYQRVSFYACCLCIIPGINSEKPSSACGFSLFFIKNDQEENWKNFAFGSKNSSAIFFIEKLPSCYVPKFIINRFLERNRIFSLQDILVNTRTKRLLLDKLSRVCLVKSAEDEGTCNTGDIAPYSFAATKEIKMKTLDERNTLLPLNKLSLDCEENTLVSVEGIISGIIEDSAMFWTVCGNCGLEANKPVIQQVFYCHSCRQNAKSHFHVQLEITLQYDDIPDAEIIVKLLESTVFEYLPMEISDSFDGYDTECIFGRTFGKKLCYVSSLKKQYDAQKGHVSIISICLKEVIVAEGIENFIEI